MTWRENQCRRILSLSLQKQLFHLTKSAVNQTAKTAQWIEICLHRSSEEGPDAIDPKRHGGSRVSHVPSRKLLQVRFHPHTVWSSLARTDSDGFLAPCKHNVEKTRTTKRSFTSMQMVHTHTHTHDLTVLDLRVTVRVKSRGSPSGTCPATSLNLSWILLFVATKSSRALKV